MVVDTPCPRVFPFVCAGRVQLYAFCGVREGEGDGGWAGVGVGGDEVVEVAEGPGGAFGVAFGN